MSALCRYDLHYFSIFSIVLLFSEVESHSIFCTPAFVLIQWSKCITFASCLTPVCVRISQRHMCVLVFARYCRNCAAMMLSKDKAASAEDKGHDSSSRAAIDHLHQLTRGFSGSVAKQCEAVSAFPRFLAVHSDGMTVNASVLKLADFFGLANTSNLTRSAILDVFQRGFFRF